MEIITGVERRRRWRPEEKLRILAELGEPEDGCLWIYDTDDRATLGLTERGIESLQELIADQKR